MTNAPYHTAKEIAAELGVSVDWVRRALASDPSTKTLPGHKRPIFYARETVGRLMEGKTLAEQKTPRNANHPIKKRPIKTTRLKNTLKTTRFKNTRKTP